MSEYIPEWVAMVNNPDTSNAISDISHVISQLFEYVPYRFQELNLHMEMIEPNTATAQYLVAVLRTSFSWRNQLPYWTTLRIKSYDSIMAQGLNANQILRGLNNC
jgi:hypothetical protein